jgi:small subunit ribosomal protein S20
MANIRSALKRIRQNEKRRLRNAAIRSGVRSALKSARTAVTEGSPDARDAVVRTIQTLDKAVTKGVIHRNAAARKKSRLARKLNAAGASPQPR